jgi:hypothetical protein
MIVVFNPRRNGGPKKMVGLGRFELPTRGLGIQRAVFIGVENFRLYMQCQAVAENGC